MARKTISLWLGVLCILYAGLYLLGFLPVSVWQYVLDLFIERSPNTYYKIVPSEGGTANFVVVLLVGLALITYAKYPIKRNSSEP